MRGGRSLVFLAPGAFSACVEYDFVKERDPTARPDIEVRPGSLDFGALEYGARSAELLRVSNEGARALSLGPIELAGADAFALTVPAHSGSLEPGESIDLVVEYTPWSTADEAMVRVQSDDPDEPELEVPLFGALNVPLLVFSPDPLDMGGLPIGASTTGDLRVSNGGVATLEITDMMLSGDAFAVELPAFPLTLDAGEYVDLPVTFTALVEGELEGRLWAASNAGSGSDSVALEGLGSAGPVAVCSVEPAVVTSHDELPTWIGNESYDPAGAEIVSYEWTLLERPEGSMAEMPGDERDADRPDFVWDLAGAYLGRLVVENEHGQVSEPCDALLVAAPSDDLWIEMYWTEPQDDMDLHLLAPGGSKWSSQDCHWQNCVDGSLDWGDPSEDADDPSLDLDDIPGTGPENIRIEEPEPGEFTVLVHDYEASRYRDPNAVTVNIYVGGELVFTDTREIEGEDGWESFAYVTFPEGTVTEL